MKKFKRAFTMVELLIVIVIISTFALLSSYGYNKLKESSFNESNRVTAAAFNAALKEIYLAGRTSQGVIGQRGVYMDIKTACLDPSNTVFEDIIAKHKNVPKDLRIAYVDGIPIQDNFFQANNTYQTSLWKSSTHTTSNNLSKIYSCDASASEIPIETLSPDHAPIIVYRPNHRLVSKLCYDQTETSEFNDTVEPCEAYTVYYIDKNDNQYKLAIEH